MAHRLLIQARSAVGDDGVHRPLARLLGRDDAARGRTLDSRGCRRRPDDRYYVDGVAAGASTALVPFLPGTGPSYIGFQRDDGVYFAGDVDELRIWNRALGAAEVAAVCADPH